MSEVNKSDVQKTEEAIFASKKKQINTSLKIEIARRFNKNKKF